MAIKFQNSGGWAPVPGTAGTFASPTRLHERVAVTEMVSEIPITLPVRPGDFLTVLRDNLPLVEGVDFTRGEGHVALTDAAEPGSVIDIHLMHFEIAPTRGHVDDRGNPHGVTAAQLGDDTLTEGGLLKLKGGKLTKAVPGTDYSPANTVEDHDLSLWSSCTPIDRCYYSVSSTGVVAVHFAFSATTTKDNFFIFANLPSTLYPTDYVSNTAAQKDSTTTTGCRSWIRPYDGGITILPTKSGTMEFYGSHVFLRNI